MLFCSVPSIYRKQCGYFNSNAEIAQYRSWLIKYNGDFFYIFIVHYLIYYFVQISRLRYARWAGSRLAGQLGKLPGLSWSTLDLVNLPTDQALLHAQYTCIRSANCWNTILEIVLNEKHSHKLICTIYTLTDRDVVKFMVNVPTEDIGTDDVIDVDSLAENISEKYL